MVFFICMLAFCVFILVRNRAVYSERGKMIDIVFAQQEWQHYRDLMDSVRYDSMVLNFWIWPVYKMWPTELQELREQYR